MLPFNDSPLWLPFKERVSVDIDAFRNSGYFAIKMIANFTIPEDAFFERFSEQLPLNTTNKEIFYP